MTVASIFPRAFARPACTASLLCVFLLVAPAAAQKKTILQIPQPKDFDAAKRSAAMTMISSGQMAAADEKTLSDYFQSLFADMTNPDKSRDIHRTRLSIKNQLKTAGNASDKSTHTAANRLMLEKLPIIVKGAKFHPAVRYNCALLLAELDSVEKQNPTDVPTPLPAALDKLIEVLGENNVNDSIRLAVIVGLTRHATTGDDASRAKIAKASLAFLDRLEKSDSAARKQDVKYWLESRTMETIGETLKPTPEVVAALQTRLADENRPIWVRCVAASSLGKLQYPADSKVDANALFPDFKKLLDTAVDQNLTRRELRYVLYAVRRGLDGFAEPPKDSLATLLTGDTKTQSTAMANAIGEMAKICEEKKNTSARVPLLIEKVVEKWRAGQISGTERSAEASETLNEDASGSEESQEGTPEGVPAEEGAEDTDVFGE